MTFTVMSRFATSKASDFDMAVRPVLLPSSWPDPTPRLATTAYNLATMLLDHTLDCCLAKEKVLLSLYSKPDSTDRESF